MVYDYFRAEILAKEFGLDVSGVYLIGYPTPLSIDAAGRPQGMLHLDLSGKKPAAIEEAMAKIDRQFTFVAWEAAATGDTSVLTTMRKFFASVGTLLLSTPPAQADEATRCQ